MEDEAFPKFSQIWYKLLLSTRLRQRRFAIWVTTHKFIARIVGTEIVSILFHFVIQPYSHPKTFIFPQAYELSTLTGTQVMLLVASETGHVYTFATRKLQPMITSDSGKRLIQTCLNSPDPPQGAGAHGGDQRMSATGFEETELTYNIADDETKVRQLVYGGSPGHMGGGGHGGAPQPYQHMDHHGMGMSPQGYHQHGPCASPLPLPPSLAQQYAHPHMTHAHPQR